MICIVIDLGVDVYSRKIYTILYAVLVMVLLTPYSLLLSLWLCEGGGRGCVDKSVLDLLTKHAARSGPCFRPSFGSFF